MYHVPPTNQQQLHVQGTFYQHLLQVPRVNNQLLFQDVQISRSRLIQQPLLVLQIPHSTNQQLLKAPQIP